MSDIAIRVENLGKKYSLGLTHAGTIRDKVDSLSRRLLRSRAASDEQLATSPTSSSLASSPPHLATSSSHSPLATPSSSGARLSTLDSQLSREFWALKDVSFDVHRGDVVGVIGRNGAGKSTLLKILSQITTPSSGRAEIHGRVGSLLEVGTGFHPELTGRENVFLNGAILGMKYREVKRRFDEIVEFSGVTGFIDTPVKRYSSGMKVRLAFAVAAHLEPEVLIIDEVLAVGDAEFQRRCLGKMQDVAGQGRTILFVSHNVGAVRRLTNKCLYLVDGMTIAFGETDRVTAQYVQTGLGDTEASFADLSRYRRDDNPDAAAQFKSISVNGEAVGTMAHVPIGSELRFEFDLAVRRDEPCCELCVQIKTGEGDDVTTLISADKEPNLKLVAPSTTIVCRVRDLCLRPSTYLLSVGINPAVGRRAWDAIVDVPVLSVTNVGDHRLDFRPDRPGLVICRDVSWFED